MIHTANAFVTSLDDEIGPPEADDAKPEEQKPNGNSGPAAKFPLVPFDDLKPGTGPDYVVKGLLPCIGLAVFWGPPKCGKSFFVFDLLMHVALGWKYRERRVQQGPVVYCAFEGAAGFHKRAETFRHRHDVPPNVPFYLMPTRADLVKDHKALIAAITAHQVTPAVICLDTLNRSLVGSESKDEDMSAYIAAADALREAFNCLIIIVHHCGINDSRPRGHTSLTGAVDAQIKIDRDRGGANNVVTLVEYMKDGPEGERIVSRLESVEIGTDEDGDPITSCVVVPDDEATAPKARRDAARLPKAARTALRALREAVVEVGQPAPTSNHIPPKAVVVTIDQWRVYAYRLGISDGEDRAKQRAFKRAYEHLVGIEIVGVWDENVWLPE